MGPVVAIRRNFWGVGLSRRLTVLLVASSLGVSCSRRVWAEEVNLAELESRLSQLTFASMHGNLRRLVGKRARDWARLAEGAAEFARGGAHANSAGQELEFEAGSVRWDSRLSVAKGRLNLLALRTAQSRMSGLEEYRVAGAEAAGAAGGGLPPGGASGVIFAATSRSREADDSSGAESDRPIAAGEPPKLPQFVEAFLSQAREVANARQRMLSSEYFRSGGVRGWALVEEESQHFGTVAWYDPQNTGPLSTPLVNRNSLELIARAAGVIGQQGDRGFVFGRVGPGWEVRLKGASNLVYLYGRNDEGSFGRGRHFEGSVIPADDLVASQSEERYFVGLNVAGGARVVELEHVAPGKLHGERASVRLPVFSGQGTFADLSLVGERKLFLKIARDGGSEALAGFAGIEVDGQLGRKVEPEGLLEAAQGGGRVSIPRVITVGEYPIYLHMKTLDERDPTLEYRFVPSEMGSEDEPFGINEVAGWRISDWATRAGRPLAGQKGSQLVVGTTGGILNELGERLDPLARRESEGEFHLAAVEGFSATGDVLKLPVWTFGSERKALSVSDTGALNSKRSQVFFGVELPRGIVRSRVIRSLPGGGEVAWSRLDLFVGTNSSEEENIVSVIDPH